MKCVLKDLIAVSKDGEWGKGEPFDDSVEMHAIRGTDFANVRLGNATATPRRHIRKQIAERKRLQPWDVIIEVAGGTKDQITGRTVLLRPHLFSRSPLPLTCASFSRFIRFNTARCDPEFMFWYLQHLYARGAMHEYHTQHTGVARFQWTTFSEREPISLPALPVQRRIGGILSAYDELIENSHARIKLLESMARGFYREWFVHFRYPGHESVPRIPSALGEIPLGWEVKKLKDICHLTMGQSPKSEFYNEIGDGVAFHQGVTDFGDRFPSDRLFCTAEGRVAEAGDVLFSVRAPVGRMNIATKKIVLGRGLSAIRHSNGRQAFLWEQLRNRFTKDDMMGNGAIFASVTKDDMRGIELLSPPSSLVDAASEYLEPLHREIFVLTQKIQNLRRTRDLLLPRLLSGQFKLGAAAVEAAAA
jgi:type I restriction enzyme S subunit